MSGLPKPLGMDAHTWRRRVVRALLIQTALWTPTPTEKDAILEAMQEQQDWEDSPSPLMAGRRGLSALTHAACCAAVKGSAGSPGEVATNASVWQHRGVGVPRNRPQQLPTSHHLTTVIIISPDCPTRPPLHNLYVSAARFSSNQSLSALTVHHVIVEITDALQGTRHLQDSDSAAH